MAFDIVRFTAAGFGGHGNALGLRYHDHGEDWAELALPYQHRLAGDADSGALAAGPIIAMLDMATSLAVWLKRRRFAHQATLDLRVDQIRRARAGGTVFGRGECVALTGSIAFVRGVAYDQDIGDPLAQVAGTFMLMDRLS
ncbi:MULTISPECIES: PaaI family thioesterase [unclassified Sphingomonas]|uniref:PaaI family thioesterase n=1 Tax=unclassified Sphingomonas TaxID=196159 RepID=UPI002269871B|nr:MULTISPECIES: PaaI family thioesterase [unclassified Sphingomonas]